LVEHVDAEEAEGVGVVVVLERVAGVDEDGHCVCGFLVGGGVSRILLLSV
jgi:hypothetical protein